jgi:hypothetical protein
LNVARGAALLALASCAARPAPEPARTPPPDPPATTEWHAEPVLDRRFAHNVVLLQHADASLPDETIVGWMQQQYDWLRAWVGFGPEWIFVHVGAHYPCGMTMRAGEWPEMFLRADSILDTSADVAHEMMHAFDTEVGALPHWFNESMSDVAWVDSEVELWHRREAGEFLASLDRVDHRSYELLELRRRFGRDYFPRVYREIAARLDECRRTFRDDVPLEDKNRLLLALLSTAAGEDLEPVFRKEFGFNPKTRERQRGY